MNTYKKYCPNVFVAQCTEQHEKGDEIEIKTKYGKVHECMIHNFLGKHGEYFLYSITRCDGFDFRERAKMRAEKLETYADNAEARGEGYRERSNEGADFLRLAEPIKVGHHSERRHRNLIDRNWKRMGKAVEEFKKADGYKNRVAYWESLSKTINLSVPESVAFFAEQLEEAKDYHEGLKNGTYHRLHSYSLTYAKKRVNELTKKVETAEMLWG